MINPKTKQRELAYIVKIDKIEEIQGSDHCEAAVVGGWRIMTRKGTFQPGDFAVYFEIDSKVPAKPEFEFLARKHFKIKTQKYTFGGKGNFISQGLLMSFADFTDSLGRVPCWLANFNMATNPLSKDSWEDHRWLTKELGVTYSVEADNKRKHTQHSKKYKDLDKFALFRWMKKHKTGRKILEKLFDKKISSWPHWVKKTDSERVQNIPFILENKEPWIATEKIDGTSTTFTVKKGLFGYKYYVCSRNVCFDTKEKAENCFYDTNVYIQMSEKYNVKNALLDIAKRGKYKTVALQGETFGPTIQKRDYSQKEVDFRAFDLIIDEKKMDILCAKLLMKEYKIPWVPILDTAYILPDTVDEILEYVKGASAIDGLEREGIVFRQGDDEVSTSLNFKGVSNDFLLKYHN